MSEPTAKKLCRVLTLTEYGSIVACLAKVNPTRKEAPMAVAVMTAEEIIEFATRTEDCDLLGATVAKFMKPHLGSS